jgi:hypothetical protein
MCMFCRLLFFLLAIVLSVLRFTDFDYTFKFFLLTFTKKLRGMYLEHYQTGRPWSNSISFTKSMTMWVIVITLHLSSVTTITRAYERGKGEGSVGTSVKCHHCHQGLWEGSSAITSVKCHHYHQGLWGGIQTVHLSSVATIRAYERGVFNLYIF